jgi:hypothetical protein
MPFERERLANRKIPLFSYAWTGIVPVGTGAFQLLLAIFHGL